MKHSPLLRPLQGRALGAKESSDAGKVATQLLNARADNFGVCLALVKVPLNSISLQLKHCTAQEKGVLKDRQHIQSDPCRKRAFEGAVPSLVSFPLNSALGEVWREPCSATSSRAASMVIGMLTGEQCPVPCWKGQSVDTSGV
jgi:hypothetical protein